MNDDMDVPDQDEDQVPLFPYSDDMVLPDKELTASKESVSAVPPPILCFGPAPAGHICSRCTSTTSHAQSRRNDMQSAMFTALRESINMCNPSPQRHPHSTQSPCLVATVPTVSAVLKLSASFKKSRKPSHKQLPPELIHQIVAASAYLCPVCSRAHLESCSTTACLSLCPLEPKASLRCQKCKMVYCETCSEMDVLVFCDLCDQSYCTANGSKPGCGDIVTCECKCIEACTSCVCKSDALVECGAEECGAVFCSCANCAGPL
ncbi:hypothetical protein BJ741DRAFT_704006, partial [Chytriomyces cf. hyalinus JEL632]